MLHLLQEYAKREGLDAKPGYSSKTIRAILVWDRDRRTFGVNTVGQAKRGLSVPSCPTLSQPEIKGAGAGCRHFLVDNAKFVTLLGFDDLEEGDRVKVEKQHRYFLKLLGDVAAGTELVELGQIAEALTDSAELESVRRRLHEAGVKPTDNVTFAIEGRNPSWIVEDETWHDWWDSFRERLLADKKKKVPKSRQKTDQSLMRCLLTGDLVPPAPTHPKIKGLTDVGGLAMGDVLASFKQGAFRSYNLPQSANAAMSEQSASVYTHVLNELIETKSRRLANVKALFWYSEDIGFDPTNTIEDPTDEWAEVSDGTLDDPDRRASAVRMEERARKHLDSLRAGTKLQPGDVECYSLLLGANSGRVVIRDFDQVNLLVLTKNIAAWFEDLAIAPIDGKTPLAKPPKFHAIIGACFRELKDAPAPAVAGLWRAAVLCRDIPAILAANALHRFRIGIIEDEYMSHARVGLMKAALLRKYRLHPRKELFKVSENLNPNQAHPAYQCGRLMAVLADLQRAALGDVGAGIVQRYYSSASQTPALVLGRLLQLSQHHLSKIKSPGLRHWFDDQIQQIAGSEAMSNNTIPKTLKLDEQTLFALGYYQQKAAARRASNDTDQNEAETTSIENRPKEKKK